MVPLRAGACDADPCAAVDPQARYHCAFDKGPRCASGRIAAEPRRHAPLARGATLIALAQQRFPDAETAAEAKRRMRDVLDHYFEARGVESRRVVQDPQALGEERSEECD